ncbi:hypothetical protein PILCRDRAFT_15773 [Piloderma croceum F 1598]|uniref:Mid2 domain-containing protein n=1 Tax=Piloderma croceum (strain F 1598) TaxID=765440 RepID=A0A0C3EYM7_PILCF|nr:hypothetical protein PILCRDRAFT_15773 [Piloderma croceum F 1598]
MRLALSVYFFLAAASVDALSTTGDIWGGINITQMVLQVATAISTPTCNATTNCTQLTTVEIPSCLTVLGSPGCWCSLANLYPVHYCAICMSTPLDNTTTPEQTQTPGESHMNYHIGCNAYQAFLNGTSTSNGTTTSSMTSSSSSASASTIPAQTATTTPGPKSIGGGAIGGVAVGGLIGLALIVAAGCLLYRRMQNKHERAAGSMQRTSVLSHNSKYPFSTGDNSPAIAYTPPSNPYIQGPNAPYDTRMLNLLPQV